MQVGGDAEQLRRLLGLQNVPMQEALMSSMPLSAPELRNLKDRMQILSDQVKDRVRHCIASQRNAFSLTIDRAGVVSVEFDSICDSLHILLNTLAPDDPAGAGTLCKELSELVDQMRKITLEAKEKKRAFNAIEHISTLKQRLTKASAEIPEGDLLFAAENLLEIRDELGLSSHAEDEGSYTTHAGEARPYIFLKEIWSTSFSEMSYILQELFSKAVVLDTSTSTLHVHVSLEQGSACRLGLSALLIAMEKIGLLEAAYAKFADALFKNVVNCIVHNPLKVDILEKSSEMTRCSLIWLSKPTVEDGVALAVLYAKLVKLVRFVYKHLCCENDSWMKKLGRFIWPRMADAIITSYLSMAVPSEVHEVARFQDLASLTSEFEMALVKLNFIPGQPDILGKFASDVEMHFASHKKLRILARARRLLVRAEFSTFSKRKSSEPATNDEYDNSEELLFQPESCVVSQTAKHLMEIVHELLEDACAAASRVSVELYHAARDVFFLYLSIMPVKLDMKLNNISKEAIIYHNDCIYLAQESLGLAFQYSKAMPVELEKRCVFVDLYPTFSSAAEGVRKDQLKLIGMGLDEALDHANGFKNTNKPHSFEMASLAIDQVVFLLEKVRMIWQPLMAHSIYAKSMGVLMSSVFARLTLEILNLDDMDVKETEQLRKLIFSLEERLFPLLQSLVGDGEENQGQVERAPQSQLSVIGQLVPSWCKLLRLGELLDMSLVSIVRAWESGNLINCGFSVFEVQKLIKAVFSDTDLRKESLQRVAGKTFIE